MRVRTLVVLHLATPTEKFWGVLEHLGPEGVTIRGVSLPSFDDWMRDVASGRGDLGLTTMFVPMTRVERMFADEQIGEVESYAQRFARYVGRTPERELAGLLEVGESSGSIS